MSKRIISDGKKVFEVLSVGDNFDKAVACLAEKQVPLATTEELAEARVLDAKVQGSWLNSELCTNGFWTAENYNYYPNGEILIASREFNPILKQPRKATYAHKSAKEFYLDERTQKALRERAEIDPEKAIKSGVLLLPRTAYRSSVPTTAFEDYAPTRFHFRQQAAPYGIFLAEQGIKSVGHQVFDEETAREQPKPFGRALWVYGLNSGSALGGNHIFNSAAGHGQVCGVTSYARIPQELRGLEPNILQALKEGVAFDYNGTIYVPVSREAIARVK
ncbi:MAG TPA: hypothetical protein VI612_00680 [Candidatus Nanoarchaeia archaeon]|nr:hypothetical protein [Candidatus Nanoarchaeia archaeon]